MADSQKELKIVISADTSKAKDSINGFSGTLKNIGTVAAGLGLERIAEKALQMGKAFVEGSVAAFAESEKLNTQLQTVLKSTKGVAGVSQDMAVSLSKSLQSATTYSDEAVLSAENLLLTFTKIGKDVFPEATKTVLDMSTALGQDTKSSAIQLGKALQDPITGITALRRVGVNFTEDQKEQIKTLMEHNDVLGAQKIIMSELNTEFGGSAAAAATTYEGRLQQLKNTFDEIQEVVGRFIVDAITPLLNFLAPLMDTLKGVAEGTKSWGDVMNYLKMQFPEIAAVWDVVIGTIRKTTQEFMPYISGIWNSFKDLISSVMQALIPIVQVVLDYIKMFWDKFGKDILQSTKGAFEIILGAIKLSFDLISGAFKIFKDIFTGNWTQLWTDFKGIVTKIIDDVKSILKGFFDWAGGVVNGLIEGVKSIGSGVAAKGKATGGFASGLTLVGERGPELVSLPQGSYVHDSEASKGMMGGTTININNPTVRNDQDIQSIAEAVKNVLGRQGELAAIGAY